MRILILPAGLTTAPYITECTDDLFAHLDDHLDVPHRAYGVSTFRHFGLQAVHDDEGLFREDPVLNVTTTIVLDDLLNEGRRDGQYPMVGDWALFGLDRAGESIDVPQHIVDAAMTAHDHAVSLIDAGPAGS